MVMPDVGYFNSDSMTTFSINRPFALAILIVRFWPKAAPQNLVFSPLRTSALEKSGHSAAPGSVTLV